MATGSVGSSLIAGSAGVLQLVQLDSWVYLAAGSAGSFLMASSARVTKQSGTVRSELARVLQELSRGASQGVCQGCLQLV